MAKRARHRPNKLSVGERQRVAIARALANDPALLLADEPTGNLDSDNSVHVMDLLLSFQRERGLALLVVTHSNEIAERADHIVRIKDGKVLEDAIAPSVAAN
jgi:putative ABC transport system ATP-binding protein